MSVAMPDDPSHVKPGHPRARRVRDEGVPPNDRTYTVLMHLSPLSWLIVGPFGLVVPLVMWLVRKESSEFIDDHGRDIVNFGISQLIIGVICFVLMFVIIGFPLLLAQMIVILISMIRGAAAANNGEYFRYPMTFRFIQ